MMSVLCFQFAEKFAEYKEAARLAKEKSQEKMEMATSPSQVGSRPQLTKSKLKSNQQLYLSNKYFSSEFDHTLYNKSGIKFKYLSKVQLPNNCA